VLYYVIYNPEFYQRDRHNRLEVYKLRDDTYQPYETGKEPVWMPEVGLGIGRDVGVFNGWEREWLYWYDQAGQRYPSPPELWQSEHDRAEQEKVRAEQEKVRAEQEKVRAEQEKVRAEQEKVRADRLTAKLKELGIDPETL
jgi:hypothetical protein